MFFQENGQYRCAVYLRLSRSDGDQQESNSIKNQRALLNDYLGKHPELYKVDEYVDDGYSGTNFERPDFKRMMQDIEKRNVNCIIVKDLSRFGRNYIETGRYLERIFPFMGIRFIAINDHYDSAEENDDKGRILIPFNNLINDTYCRDISMRVRSHLDVKRKEGQFIGSFAGLCSLFHCWWTDLPLSKGVVRACIEVQSYRRNIFADCYSCLFCNR